MAYNKLPCFVFLNIRYINTFEPGDRSDGPVKAAVLAAIIHKRVLLKTELFWRKILLFEEL